MNFFQCCQIMSLIKITWVLLFILYTYRNCTVKESIFKICIDRLCCSHCLCGEANANYQSIFAIFVRTASFSTITRGNWSDCSHLFCPDIGKCWPVGWGVARPVDIPGPNNRSVLLAVMLVPGLRSLAPKAVRGWNTRRVMLDQRGPDLSKLEKRWLDLHVTFSR